MTNTVTRKQLDDYSRQLDSIRCSDRGRLIGLLSTLRQRLKKGQDVGRQQAKLLTAIETSTAWVTQRREKIKVPQYPADLPVVERRDEIGRAIRDNPVVIIAGETGSGKTTQLPKICLEVGRGARGLIGHTQPRRLAARTVAQRIASELGSELGAEVGFQIRFNQQVSESSLIKLMTDGILLAEIQRDRYLSEYDTLIIDEAHERSLNIDFLLGYLKQLLPRRPDLKIIITSATIDVQRFSEHFDGAPIVEVTGRTYPVETRYREYSSEEGLDLSTQIIQALDEIVRESARDGGDVLIFLPGERDIREVAVQIRQHNFRDMEVLPLYARLSNDEQNRVFDTKGQRGRRVVLATNVAETSLTVPGIRYVIDPGLARISRYSYRTKVQRLPVEAISQASANQRQGRCGRVRDGICYRLYAESDFQSRPEFTDPEIQRTNLAAVILKMLDLGLGDIHNFPFVDPPDSRMVTDGYRLLEELGAVDKKGELNSGGRSLARIPIDPRLGQMLLVAAGAGGMREVLIIVSALSVQDPRERPADKKQAADEQHRRFWHEQSDFLAHVALWDYYEEQRQALTQNQLRKLCKREFLSFMRMREWRDIHYQLTTTLRQMKLPVSQEEASYEVVHRAILSGLLSHVAQWREERDYDGVRNRKLQIFPGSSQAKKRPKWIMAAEVVETSRVFAREVAKIEPGWVLGINDRLLKYHYYEPHWHMRSGRVMAYERISLLGLTVADKKKVHYGPIDAVVSRELFIRSGLVEGRCRSNLPFLRANASALTGIESLEAKIRRRDLAASEQVLYDFYQSRIPEDILTTRALDSWYKKHPEQLAGLEIDRSLLLLRDPGVDTDAQFPDELLWEDMRFELEYHFEPGHHRDGVTVTVPVGLLNRLPRYRFDWLVPGLLREKCIELLRGLPKSVRKHLVPIPDYVDRALVEAEPSDQPLTQFLAGRIKALAGLEIGSEEWGRVELDAFYRLNFKVVDAEGKLLEEGRDLDVLCRRCASELRELVSSGGGPTLARDGITRWDFDELPEVHEFRQAGVDIRSYPALVDRGSSVAIELLDYPEQAYVASRQGLVRLCRLHCAQEVKYLRKRTMQGNRYSLLMATAGVDRDSLMDDFVSAVFTHLVLDGVELARSKATFGERISTLRRELGAVALEYETLVANILEQLALAKQRVSSLSESQYAETRLDMENQMASLVGPQFLTNTPREWLQQYPRYLKAVVIRAERTSGQLQRDVKYSRLLEPLYARLYSDSENIAGRLLMDGPEQRYRWMLEEFRVSLYAQSLGTIVAVSEKRLVEQWARVAGTGFGN
ncbi:MAG: ATP-dependent helicase HrpA [Halieaceae bacterium]|jgi:ATP-dependent helicase HrpA